MVVLSGGIRKGLLKVGDPCRILEEGPFARQSRGHRSFKAKDSAGAKDSHTRQSSMCKAVSSIHGVFAVRLALL